MLVKAAESGMNLEYFIHLDHIYFNLKQDQPVDFTGFEITITSNKLDQKGSPTNEIISSEVRYIDKNDLREPVDLNKYSKWNLKINIPYEFIRTHIRLYKLVEGESSESPKKKFFDAFSFSFNNKIKEIDSGFVKELLVTELREIFKVPKYIWCGVPPIGGTDNDMLILQPKTTLIQHFKFSDFYEKDLYNASFISINLSWWNIKIIRTDIGPDFSKTPVLNNFKKLVSTIVNLPGVVDLLKDTDVFDENALDLLNQENIPDKFIKFFKFSSVNNDSISDPNKRKYFYLTFIGDLNLLKEIK